MALKMSTGLVNKLLDTGSLKSVLNLCFIDIYTGAQPGDANDAPTGTKLVTISNASGATGLTWEATATDGILEKTAGETWSGVAVASANAGWFRIRLAADGLGSSTTDPRIDGQIANSGAQMNIPNVVVTSGGTFVVSNGSVTLPKA